MAYSALAAPALIWTPSRQTIGSCVVTAGSAAPKSAAHRVAVWAFSVGRQGFLRRDGLVGAVLIEQNDEWQTQNRYMQTEGMAEMMTLAVEARPLQIIPNCRLTDDHLRPTIEITPR